MNASADCMRVLSLLFACMQAQLHELGYQGLPQQRAYDTMLYTPVNFHPPAGKDFVLGRLSRGYSADGSGCRCGAAGARPGACQLP
jgi:hypothetical protein